MHGEGISAGKQKLASSSSEKFKLPPHRAERKFSNTKRMNINKF